MKLLQGLSQWAFITFLSCICLGTVTLATELQQCKELIERELVVKKASGEDLRYYFSDGQLADEYEVRINDEFPKRMDFFRLMIGMKDVWEDRSQLNDCANSIMESWLASEDPEAYFWQAIYYRYGAYGVTDEIRYLEYLEKAANFGHENAAIFYAGEYYTGDDLIKFKQAMGYLNRAAKAGAQEAAQLIIITRLMYLCDSRKANADELLFWALRSTPVRQDIAKKYSERIRALAGKPGNECRALGNELVGLVQ